MGANDDFGQKIYTIDLEPDRIPLEPEQGFLSSKEKKVERVHARIKRNNLREAAFNSEVEISQRFEKNIDVCVMRKGIKKAQTKVYDDAFNFYIKGKWAEAK